MTKIVVLSLSLLFSVFTTISLDYELVWLNIFFVFFFVVFYILVFVFLFFFIAFILGLFINRKKEVQHYNKFYHFVYNVYVNIGLSLFCVNTKKVGLDKIPTNSNYLLVFNHLSNFDPIVIEQCLYKSNLAFVSKKSLFKIPFFGKFIHKIGYISLDRTNVRSDAVAIKKGTQMLEANECSIAVAPEGTRNFTDEVLLPFRAGCFHLAMKSHRPIVISSIKGTENIKHHILTKKHVVVFEIIEVMYYEEYKDLTSREISEYVFNKIYENLTR